MEDELNNKPLPEGTAESAPRGSKKVGKKIARTLRSVLDGSFLTRERVIRAIPFLLFLFMLTLAYIANVFYVEKIIREMDDVEKELQELRFEYITTKSKLMKESKASEVAKKLEKEGIKPSTAPPEKIIVK